MNEKNVFVLVIIVIIMGTAIFCFADQVRVVAFYPTPFGIYDILRARIYLDCDLYNNREITAVTARFLKPSQESACETFIVSNNIQTSMIRGTRSTDVRNRDVSLPAPPPSNSLNMNRFIDLSGGRSWLDRLELEQALDVMGRIQLHGSNADATDPGYPGFPAGRHIFDLAEGVHCPDAISGDVVIVDINNTDAAVISTKAYDSRVMGIISDRPRVALGVTGGKKPVCLRGKVYGKVTALNGPIKRGDILVTSSKKGYAMAADPKKIKPGMIVGKALQAWEKGEGKILILVNVN